MADLARTFLPGGETDPEVPATSIELGAAIQPVTEVCRPLPLAFVDSSTPKDLSEMTGLNGTVLAGAGPTTSVLLYLRRGIWRVYLSLSFATTGAAPVATNYALLALVGPEGTFGSGVQLFSPAQNAPQYGSIDVLIHVPTDQWSVGLEVADPVTANAVNRYRGSVLCCHLL